MKLNKELKNIHKDMNKSMLKMDIKVDKILQNIDILSIEQRTDILQSVSSVLLDKVIIRL